jgi:stage II sporulation protein D
MNLRNFLLFLTIFLLASPNTFSLIGENESSQPFKLDQEPDVRIGLLRNSYSAVISTREPSLVRFEPGAPIQYLNATSVRVSSKSYRPPGFEYYRFEIPDIATREEADAIANRLKTETEEEPVVLAGEKADTWRIQVGGELETKEEADNFVAFLTEKGFENIRIISTKYTSPSDEAVLLSRQISQHPRSKVRSLTSSLPTNNVNTQAGLVRKTSSSRPLRRRNMNVSINPDIREVTVAGRGENFSSLKAVTIGTTNPRGVVYLNGKSYRGKMEVFVNANGRITVVNVVPIEDYLLGVVPAELSLPQLEAQKAQAVAARSYALGNRDAYDDEGFDMVDTVWSQVYKGVRIESRMGSQAVRETRGMVATYNGKPINAMFTSTCGGRTEDSGNIYEFDLPYLRGVNCSLDGDRHFSPFLIKSSREPALIRNDANYEFVRLAAQYGVNNFLFATDQFTDEYFEDPPSSIEIKSWLNQLAVKFDKPFPIADADSAKPLNLARILHSLIYTPDTVSDAETLMSAADLDYQLSFLDAKDIPQRDRLILAPLMRDGWFSIYSDLTIKPNKHYSRGKILNLIHNIYSKKKWTHSFETGTAKPTEDGKLILRVGRSEKEITVSPNVYLFRKFGDSFYQVKETALIGGEKVRYRANALGQIVYLEVEPSDETTVAEKMSSFTNWRTRKTAASVQAGLRRYVKGLSGALVDVRIKKRGFSKRAIELEIVTTTGVFTLKGGKIRSALRLKEQLFVMDKRYGSTGRVISYGFTGRGWGHGIGMCQYGAYGFAKMGVKYDEIINHYYTDIDLVKAY